MTLQTTVFILWVVASVLVATVFYLVYLRSVGKPATIPYRLINTRRFKILFALVTAFLVLFLVAMWTIGGLAALIDATIPVNFKMHNPLWVPAHFHTYSFTGAATMLLAFMWRIACESSGSPEGEWMKNVLLPLLVASAAGFLLMFYLGGKDSIPRRYATYPSELSAGTEYAGMAVAFIVLFVLSYSTFSVSLVKRLIAGLRK